MRFARGALADSDSLASAAQLLHDQCFDEIELDRPSLGYEPRCSTRCATCAAFWIASKTGEVMRIDLRVRPSGDPLRPPRPGQRAIAGDRTARAIHHVHDDDDRALGGGCYLLVGRDSGELDIYSDPLIDDTIDEDNRPPAARVARLPLYAWWETSPGAWRDLGKPFDSDDSSADPHAYARGVTAISTFRTARKPKTLYIIVATRHPRLYVIEASGGRIYLHRPQLMPGWIEWIVQPESDDRGASPEQAAREPDLRIACLSRAGDVVRLSPYDLMYGIPGSRESLEVLPTAVMPFDHGMLLLGTASGLFLLHKIRTHKLTAVPVTRAPVLCLDRATLTHDGATGDADYVAMGLEDGQLRVTTAERIRQLSNAELLRELAGVVSAKRAPLDSEPPPRASAKPASPAAESAPPWKYHTISKQLGSAVLVVETLQPEGAGTDTVYVLAATRDHAVRLFHATSQQAQRVRFAGLWKAHVDKLLHARRAGADRILRFELKAARAAGPDG